MHVVRHWDREFDGCCVAEAAAVVPAAATTSGASIQSEFIYFGSSSYTNHAANGAEERKGLLHKKNMSQLLSHRLSIDLRL